MNFHRCSTVAFHDSNRFSIQEETKNTLLVYNNRIDKIELSVHPSSRATNISVFKHGNLYFKLSNLGLTGYDLTMLFNFIDGIFAKTILFHQIKYFSAFPDVGGAHLWIYKHMDFSYVCLPFGNEEPPIICNFELRVLIYEIYFDFCKLYEIYCLDLNLDLYIGSIIRRLTNLKMTLKIYKKCVYERPKCFTTEQFVELCTTLRERSVSVQYAKELPDKELYLKRINEFVYRDVSAYFY